MKTLTKYVLSYFKQEWALDDYPIRTRNTKSNRPADFGDEAKVVPWEAYIDKWRWMAGFGDSEGEALVDLKRRFNEYKLSNNLPRPGTTVPPHLPALLM